MGRDTPVLRVRLVGWFCGGGSDWQWDCGRAASAVLHHRLRVSFQISTGGEGGGGGGGGKGECDVMDVMVVDEETVQRMSKTSINWLNPNRL